MDQLRQNKASSLEEYRPKSQFTVTLGGTTEYVQNQVQTILQDLGIQFKANGPTLSGSPKANTWSRAARRQLKKRQKIDEQEHPLFTFELGTKSMASSSTQLVGTWVSGDDRDIFESFWNHLKKRVEQATGVEKETPFKK